MRARLEIIHNYTANRIISEDNMPIDHNQCITEYYKFRSVSVINFSMVFKSFVGLLFESYQQEIMYKLY